MRTFRVVPAALAALALLAAARPAFAAERGGPRPEELGTRPIEITADRLDADSGKDTVTFRGNVVAVQGDVTLHADRLDAEYSRSSRAIEKITAEGNVRVMQEGRRASAARAVFFNIEQRIVLTGGAALVQGENVLEGETVTIYLRENRSVVTGGERGRVKAVINPKGVGLEKERGGR